VGGAGKKVGGEAKAGVKPEKGKIGADRGVLAWTGPFVTLQFHVHDQQVQLRFWTLERNRGL
jgi:hypothetical protein